MFSPGMQSGGWEGEYEWLARQIAAFVAKPIRFYLSAGTLEINSLRNLNGGPNLVLTNRHLRTVLAANGYPVQLSEFPDGHDMIAGKAKSRQGLSHYSDARKPSFGAIPPKEPAS